VAENADLKASLRSAEFENRTLRESLDAARKEAGEFRARLEEATRAGREAALREDYARLGLEFRADDEAVGAMLAADAAAFGAFRKTLSAAAPQARPMAHPHV
jgi:hypothetical protein